jgi:hypothetical protein
MFMFLIVLKIHKIIKRNKMHTYDQTEIGTVKVLWDDLIAPRGLTLKITRAKELDAQELIDGSEDRE